MTSATKHHSEEEAREVIARMAALRHEIISDVEQVSESARAMTDWTYYVRRFPWVAVGVAAAAGFLLVPRKKATITPTPEQLAALANNKEFVAAATQQLKPPESVAKQLAVVLAGIAGKAALSYITAQFRASATQHQESRPSPSPATASTTQDADP
jgi:hypothetical protein